MRPSIFASRPIRSLRVLPLVMCLNSVHFVAEAAAGQLQTIVQGQGAGQASVASQLPLSGRSGQGGSVVVTETPTPGTTTSVNTINPTIQIQGPFTGSVPSTIRTPFSGSLSIRDALQRGLEYNLGAVGLTQAVHQARGQRTAARSTLLPNLVGTLTAAEEQINLAAVGLGSFASPIPGISFPKVVGPFGYVDLRARLSQTVLDLTAWNNYRAASQTARAGDLTMQDARDLVVLAVGGTYLQVIAAKARADAERSQLDTANALYRQAAERRSAGLVAQVDVNRAQVQTLVQQQRLLSLQNDLQKQKINLALLVGLPPTDQYDVTDDVPFSVAPPLAIDEALAQASARRADLQAADAQAQAADRALAAARAERLPTVGVTADYGTIGPTPSQARATFSVVGTVRVPIWEGGRAEGHIEEAEAVVAQRRAELEALRSQVESEVRKAYLDLQAASGQVDVAVKNLEVTRENLDLTRQRFEAGVTDNVEVIQAQEALATAELDRINSVFAHNVAKLGLARAIGRASESVSQFLHLP
jgi:outer membrane protein TolC